MNTLVWGEVQSGKTKWICNLLSSISCQTKGVHSLTLFLAGSNKDLKNQARDRVISHFKENWKVKKENQGFVLLEKNNHVTLISYTSNIGETNIENVSFLHLLQKKQPIVHFIFILLKNVKWFMSFEKIVKKSKNRFNFTLIDDECDFFSLSNEILEDKKINKHIHLLLDLKNTFINIDKYSISATPFAKNKLNTNLNRVIIMAHNKFHWNHYRFLNTKNIKKFRIIQNTIDKNMIITLVKDFVQANNKQKSHFLINPGKLVKDIGNEFSINRIFDYINRIKEIQKNAIIIKMTKEENIKQKDLTSNKPTIIIGGIKASRGITFEYLKKMFLYTDHTNQIKEINFSDTLQKARWCGYENENKSYKDMQIHISKNDFIKYVISATIESRLRFFIINNGKLDNNSFTLYEKNVYNDLNNWLMENTISLNELIEYESKTNSLYKYYNVWYNALFNTPPYYLRKIKTNDKNYFFFNSGSLIGISFKGFKGGKNITCIICDAIELNKEIVFHKNKIKDFKKSFIARFPLLSYEEKNQCFSNKEDMLLELHLNQRFQPKSKNK